MWEERPNQDALTHQVVIHIGFLKDRERTFDRELVSVKKDSASVKVENASLRSIRGNIAEKVMA